MVSGPPRGQRVQLEATYALRAAVLDTGHSECVGSAEGAELAPPLCARSHVTAPDNRGLSSAHCPLLPLGRSASAHLKAYSKPKAQQLIKVEQGTY